MKGLKKLLSFLSLSIILCGSSLLLDKQGEVDKSQPGENYNLGPIVPIPEEKIATEDYLSIGGSKEDNYLFALKYLGNFHQEETAREQIEAFVSEFSLDKEYELSFQEGQELYAIIPKYEGTVLKVESLKKHEQESQVDKKLLSTEKMLFVSSPSRDLTPSLQVTVKHDDSKVSFSPYISSEDNRLEVPEQCRLLDYEIKPLVTEDYLNTGGSEEDQYLFAIKYLGYFDNENSTLDMAKEFASHWSLYKEYEFAYQNGQELYVIIPKYQGTKITLDRLKDDTEELEVDYQVLSTEKVLFVMCNPSDIRPNIRITVAFEEHQVAFSPYISLKDGSVIVPQEARLLEES